MQHLGTQTIETGRLILRRFTMNDAKAMYENWASDPDVVKYITKPRHKSIEESQAILADWTGQYNNKDFYLWAIVLRESGEEPIGFTLVVHHDDSVEKVEVGYCIGKRWWNQGIASETLKAVIDYLFSEVKVNRIEALFDPRNSNSGKVMKRCGMVYEGTHRESGRNNLGRCDNVTYAILARDYKPM